MNDGDGGLHVAAADVVQVMQRGLFAAMGVCLQPAFLPVVKPNRPGVMKHILIKRKYHLLTCARTYVRRRALWYTLDILT